MEISIEKHNLRKEMREVLKSIAGAVSEKSTAIREHLMMIERFRNAWHSDRLMCFVSMPLEVDTTPFFEGHAMIVPYCEREEIIPVRIVSLNELEPSGTMHILEPTLSVRQIVSRCVQPDKIDVVLVPGLAFDRQGNRLGRGRGYYDRFLRCLPAHTLTIGLAFREMICTHIPHDENDIPVNRVVTEDGVVCI